MNKKNLLIIDDDEELCEELQEILEDEGFSVKIAFSGIKGKDLLASGDFSLVLLDLKLPEINGLELLKFVRQTRPEMKVVIISGYTLRREENQGQTDFEKGLQGGTLEEADRIVNKPFHPETIIAAIKELTGQ